jgi:short-subunit dehydrogenase
MALPPPSDTSTALVTGASSGIGADIARELAKRGHAVTLVARRKGRLDALADELTAQHGVHADSIACDLSSAAARGRMLTTANRRKRDVEILVNNAGFGTAGRFQELDAEGELTMVRTNVEAVLHLCSAFVPGMVERGRGAILNVASLAAFMPIPRQATYGATKAFVLNFSDAIGADLHGTGVTVTSLCPGPVPTEFGEVADIDEKFMDLPGVSVSPEDTAAAAVDGLEKGRRVVLPGAATKASALAGKLTPRFVALEVMRRFYPVR